MALCCRPPTIIMITVKNSVVVQKSLLQKLLLSSLASQRVDTLFVNDPCMGNYLSGCKGRRGAGPGSFAAGQLTVKRGEARVSCNWPSGS